MANGKARPVEFESRYQLKEAARQSLGLCVPRTRSGAEWTETPRKVLCFYIQKIVSSCTETLLVRSPPHHGQTLLDQHQRYVPSPSFELGGAELPHWIFRTVYMHEQKLDVATVALHGKPISGISTKVWTTISFDEVTATMLMSLLAAR